jgi:hypothetical protein
MSKALSRVYEAPDAIKALHDVAVFRASTMAEIDDCEEVDIPARLQARFKGLNVRLPEEIDFCKALNNDLKCEAKKVEETIASLERWLERLRWTQEALKAHVKESLEAEPDFARADSHGRSLKMGNNGGKAALKLDFETDENQVRYIIDQETFEKLPGRYVGQVSYLVLKSDLLREDLELGLKVDWARLERGQRVYGL